MNIQDNRENELTNDELDTVYCFLLPSEQTTNSPTEAPDLIHRALKRRKIENRGTRYMDLRFVLPTSNICERMFSKAGYALHYRRKSINPESFEEQMFLHANQKLWNISELNSILE